MTPLEFMQTYAEYYGKTLPNCVYPRFAEDVFDACNSEAIQRVWKFGNVALSDDPELLYDTLIEVLFFINSVGLYTTRQSLKAHVTEVALIYTLFRQRKELSRKVSLYQSELLERVSAEEFQAIVTERDAPELD